MNKLLRSTIKVLAIATFMFAFVSMTQAQATRTWVSGVGDDVNPCSRTAPCKTFAGAISKTAANGEIDCLDPGGFGTVTITKSITLDGQGTLGSILAAGTNGVNVNDSASGSPNTIVVALRNLSIQGAGTGFVGVNFTSGKAVHVENCIIAGFRGNGLNSHGISAALTVSASQLLLVKDTIIRDNSGSGIRTNSSGGSGINLMVSNVRSERNQNGIRAETGTRGVVINSSFSNNVGGGIEASNSGVTVDADNCMMENNTNGVNVPVAGGNVRIANCRITANTNGLNFAGGTVESFGDNKVFGNGTNQNGGSVTAVPAPAKI
jgi:hypothetical protein